MNCNLWVSEPKQTLPITILSSVRVVALQKQVGGAHTGTLKGLQPFQWGTETFKTSLFFSEEGRIKESNRIIILGFAEPLYAYPWATSRDPTPNSFFLLSWWKRGKKPKLSLTLQLYLEQIHLKLQMSLIAGVLEIILYIYKQIF